ncbi:MAG: dihydrodipicolinate reductase C-terminal domain-containing protein, partial [Candidatus Bathyarchaeia archaeon]
REGLALRSRDELEVLSIRAGGIPGIHEVIAAGPYEMISISHISFSRNTFALGALRAVEWIMKQEKPGVYSMEDVLSGPC